MMDVILHFDIHARPGEVVANCFLSGTLPKMSSDRRVVMQLNDLGTKIIGDENATTTHPQSIYNVNIVWNNTMAHMV